MLFFKNHGAFWGRAIYKIAFQRLGCAIYPRYLLLFFAPSIVNPPRCTFLDFFWGLIDPVIGALFDDGCDKLWQYGGLCLWCFSCCWSLYILVVCLDVRTNAVNDQVVFFAQTAKQFTVGVLNSLLNRCPVLSKWWCPALRMSPIHLSPLIAIHLSPSLAGGVRLFGCLQFIRLLSYQFMCLPVWLVVSGSPDVSNSFVSPYSNSFVSQSGWWCPALRMSPIHSSPLISIHVSPSLAGGVRLSGCLQFICLPL